MPLSPTRRHLDDEENQLSTEVLESVPKIHTAEKLIFLQLYAPTAVLSTNAHGFIFCFRLTLLLIENTPSFLARFTIIFRPSYIASLFPIFFQTLPGLLLLLSPPAPPLSATRSACS
jgi:hypothetical protein